MGDKLKTLEFQRLFQEYNFLSLDEEYKREFILENNNSFMEAVKKLVLKEPQLKNLIVPNSNVDNGQESQEGYDENSHSLRLMLDYPDQKFEALKWLFSDNTGKELVVYSGKEEIKEESPKKETHSEEKSEKVKSLFRMIAKKTHPDKAGSNHLSDVYMKAKKAYENNDLFELYSICHKLGISHNMDDSEKDSLSIKIKSKKEQIILLEKTFVWLWMNSNNDIEKNNYLMTFIIQYGSKFRSFFGL